MKLEQTCLTSNTSLSVYFRGIAGTFSVQSGSTVSLLACAKSIANGRVVGGNVMITARLCIARLRDSFVETRPHRVQKGSEF